MYLFKDYLSKMYMCTYNYESKKIKCNLTYYIKIRKIEAKINTISYLQSSEYFSGHLKVRQQYIMV